MLNTHQTLFHSSDFCAVQSDPKWSTIQGAVPPQVAMGRRIFVRFFLRTAARRSVANLSATQLNCREWSAGRKMKGGGRGRQITDRGNALQLSSIPRVIRGWSSPSCWRWIARLFARRSALWITYRGARRFSRGRWSIFAKARIGRISSVKMKTSKIWRDYGLRNSVVIKT